MIRKIGKYIITCTKEEIIAYNFFKHDVVIKTATKAFVLINKHELSYAYAKIFRYSNDENEITDTIEKIVQERIFQAQRLKRLID